MTSREWFELVLRCCRELRITSVRCSVSAWHVTLFVDRNAGALEERLRGWFPSTWTVEVFADMESAEFRMRYYGRTNWLKPR
jgi:hypothetical protein